MKTLLIQPIKSSLGLLTLVLALAGCTMAPYSPQPTGRTPNAKAPVVDRSARRPPGYPAPRPAPEVDVGQVPEADPFLPREYASGYPLAADPYAAPNGYGTPADKLLGKPLNRTLPVSAMNAHPSGCCRLP